MSELSSRLGTPVPVRTHGIGTDYRQSGGGLFYGTQGAEPCSLAEDVTVWYDPGTGLTDDVIPATTQARIWDTDQATTDTANVVTLDNLKSWWVLFTIPTSDLLYAAKIQDYPAIVAALTVIPLWDLFGRIWRRRQLLIATTPPATCFSSGATLTLIAGGTIGDSSFTDGPLGTNTTSAPFAMAINPVDGLLYFNDSQFNLRTLDLTTGAVATSAFSHPFASGTMQIQHSGMVFTAEGVLYQWGVVDNDTPSTFLFRYLADGSFDAELLNPASTMNVYTDPTTSYAAAPFIGPGAVGISPDGTRIYLCAAYALRDQQAVAGTTGFLAYYDVTADTPNNVTFLAGVINPITADPSAYPSPTFGSTQPAGTSTTDQGEGAAGYQSLVGNVVGLCVDPDTGDVYSVSNDVNMVRKTTADGSSVVSLSNHDAIPFAGGSPGAWPSSLGNFGGDGSPAFDGGASGYPGAQFSFAQSLCLTDCGGQLIVDSGNQCIRHLDPSGTLHTVAGDPTMSGMAYPTSTPADALTCQIHPATILQLGGGKYLLTQVGDNDTIPDALYLLEG